MTTKIRQSNLDASVITGNSSLSGSAAEDDVLLVYDTSAGAIKKVTSPNIGLQSPTITSISPTNVSEGDGTGNYTFTVTGTKFASDVTAKFINDSGSDVAFDTVTRNSSTQLTCVIAKSSLPDSGEPYDIRVLNSGALGVTLANQVNVNASPVFLTASGSLGTGNEGDSVTYFVTAQDPESAGNVTFELQSGSLGGLTLSSIADNGGTAKITGTLPQVASTTTYNFVLRAVDASSNTSSRAFSFVSTHVPVRTSFTASGSFTVPSGITAVDVLVVAGGGGGEAGNAGGGGAGGLIFMPEFPVSGPGTITVSVGNGGSEAVGSDSYFGSPGDPAFSPTSARLTAKGGGSGAPTSAPNGGSGGGAGRGSYSGGTATQPTQPGNSGAYGFGNNGGNGNPFSGGGGGGAGEGGIPGCGPARGGNGKAYTIADGSTSVYYAGGGGGFRPGNTPPGGQGGAQYGHNATANRGGGGGGNSGGGGKGIVIVAY